MAEAQSATERLKLDLHKQIATLEREVAEAQSATERLKQSPGKMQRALAPRGRGTERDRAIETFEGRCKEKRLLWGGRGTERDRAIETSLLPKALLRYQQRWQMG